MERKKVNYKAFVLGLQPLLTLSRGLERGIGHDRELGYGAVEILVVVAGEVVRDVRDAILESALLPADVAAATFALE